MFVILGLIKCFRNTEHVYTYVVSRNKEMFTASLFFNIQVEKSYRGVTMIASPVVY